MNAFFAILQESQEEHSAVKTNRGYSLTVHN